MQVQIHKDPVKYILITDFLPSDLHARILDYVNKPDLYDPNLYGPKDTEDRNYPLVKLNNNFWLDHPNAIALEIQRACWTKPVVDAMDNMDDLLFRAHSLNNLGSFLASMYNPGDYFRWHADHTHYLTMNYVVQPADVGGVFEISEQTESRKLPLDRLDDLLTAGVSVPNLANSLIIFPAMYYHRVTPVVAGQRFTVQYFLSREFPKTS